MIQAYIKSILSASVYDTSVETPVDQMKFMSKRLANTILLKREDLQPVFSFKIRGAANRISMLFKEEKKCGIIAASAGNHAQGVALAAAASGIRAVIVMPQTTPSIKVDSVEERGAEVVLAGDTFDQAYQHALDIQKKENYTFIHPYDDPGVIAGQGTIGMEIIRQIRGPLDAVFVPVGGGGLIAGVSAYIKYLRPEVKVIGVESDESACLSVALAAGKRVVLPHVGIFADGVAVAQIGEEPFKLARQFVDQVITVNTDEICGAIKDIFDDTRCVAEPAGALALAGIKKYVATETESVIGKTLLGILSGANVNFDRLRHISERTELGEKREAIIAVKIPEKPGSFRDFCQVLGKRNITEFNYRYADKQDAQVFVGIQLSGFSDRKELLNLLTDRGYTTIDMTDNELAKLHIRHMVGGHVGNNTDEQIFRFQFPERPGALMQFLEKMGQRWNISLFHYRNHGAAFGRVFMGLQVTAKESEQLEIFLKDLGYEYNREQDNPAYSIFLS